MSKKFWVLIIVGVMCFCSFGCVAIVLLVSWQNGNGLNLQSFNPTPTNTLTKAVEVSSQPQITDPKTTPIMKIEDIYNDKLLFQKDNTAMVPELDWLYYVVTEAERNGWDGKATTKLPVNANNIPSEMLAQFEKHNQIYGEKFTIPNTLTKFYIGQQAETDLNQLANSARDEFMQYIELTGVNSKYISEINTNALPKNQDRLSYHGTNSDDDSYTVTQAYIVNGQKTDYSKLQIDIYAPDVYNQTRSIFNSGVLGPQPAENSAEFSAYYAKARNLALRYLTYHEMSHVLQRAVYNTNVPLSRKTQKSNWAVADRSLYEMDSLYFIKWTNLESDNEIYNHEMSEESQAEGIAYEILISAYNMSDVQKRLTWEFLFARLDAYRDKYDKALDILTQKYPQFEITSIENKIFQDIIKQLELGTSKADILYSTNVKLGNLPAYRGYLHPRLSRDMPELWEYLKK